LEGTAIEATTKKEESEEIDRWGEDTPGGGRPPLVEESSVRLSSGRGADELPGRIGKLEDGFLLYLLECRSV